MKTSQEIFDIVSKHLLTQKAKAGDMVTELVARAGMDGRPLRPDTETSFVCKYHADDGKRCAVGCLIPPEISTIPIERMPVALAFEKEPAFFTQHGLGKVHLPLLRSLQAIHDKADPAEWVPKLVELAGPLRLTMSEELNLAAVAYMAGEGQWA